MDAIDAADRPTPASVSSTGPLWSILSVGLVRDGVCVPVVWRLCTSSATVHHRLPRRQCMVIKYSTSHPLGPFTAPYDCIDVYACISVNFLHFGADNAALGAIFQLHHTPSATLRWVMGVITSNTGVHLPSSPFRNDINDGERDLALLHSGLLVQTFH